MHSELGFNYRMEGFQGLVLDHKLRHLAAWTEERKRLARRYMEGLRGVPLGCPRSCTMITCTICSWCGRRGATRCRHISRAMASVPGLHYPIPLHRQPCFSRYDFPRQSFPIADQYARECLSLPLYVGMSDAQVDMVIELVNEFLRDG